MSKNKTILANPDIEQLWEGNLKMLCQLIRDSVGSSVTVSYTNGFSSGPISISEIKLCPKFSTIADPAMRPVVRVTFEHNHTDHPKRKLLNLSLEQDKYAPVTRWVDPKHLLGSTFSKVANDFLKEGIWQGLSRIPQAS